MIFLFFLFFKAAAVASERVLEKISLHKTQKIFLLLWSITRKLGFYILLLFLPTSTSFTQVLLLHNSSIYYLSIYFTNLILPTSSIYF